MRQAPSAAEIAAAKKVADRYVAPSAKARRGAELAPKPGLATIDRQYALQLVKDAEDDLGKRKCPGARASLALLRRLLWQG